MNAQERMAIALFEIEHLVDNSNPPADVLQKIWAILNDAQLLRDTNEIIDNSQVARDTLGLRKK